MAAIPSVMLEAKRGKKTNGVSTNYYFHGYCKEPLKLGQLGQYCFKKNTTDAQKISITEGVATLVHQMEKIGHTLIYCLQDDKDFLVVKEDLDLSYIAGTSRNVSTQFSPAVGYWSPMHYDLYKYVCVLSVLSKKRDDRAVMYYFCFPEYNIVIPLRSGDVLVFKPLWHSCTKCCFADGYIFSAYVSNNTVMTTGIWKYNIKRLNKYNFP